MWGGPVWGGVPSGVGPSVYVCVGGSPPGSGRVCVCVCWGVPSGVGLPSRPGAGGVPSLSGGGAGGGGPTARGAPAPGRSEAVCAEMGRQWRRLKRDTLVPEGPAELSLVGEIKDRVCVCVCVCVCRVCMISNSSSVSFSFFKLFI